ncbi:MAG TPA: SpoIID/LytB domain-containing protein, partial [Blastocatellia bacterium]|nr:SpoIID/LytB domain-containing protein [Blastocatellia bacterium]
MLHLPLITLALALPSPTVDSVRIGLASLFKPTEVRVTILDGPDAVLEVGGVRLLLRPSEEIRVVLHPGADEMQLVGPDSRSDIPSAALRVRLISTGSAMQLVLPGKLQRRVRGDLSISPSVSRRSLLLLLHVDLESAVSSVVAAELAGNRNTEALKAMAIVARTYMLSHLARHKFDGFDFCDTTHCQFYRGEDDWMEGLPPPVVAAAVSATKGEIVCYRGSIVETYYTAACGGLTHAPRAVWGGRSRNRYHYVRVACVWCRESPYWRWDRSASTSLVFDAVSSSAGFHVSDNAELIARADRVTGLVRDVLVKDGRRSVAMNVETFRSVLGRRLGWNTVRSPSFTIERRGSSFLFRG